MTAYYAFRLDAPRRAVVLAGGPKSRGKPRPEVLHGYVFGHTDQQALDHAATAVWVLNKQLAKDKGLTP